jgi:poly(3-hydroxybutyrate) depolymerase
MRGLKWLTRTTLSVLVVLTASTFTQAETLNVKGSERNYLIDIAKGESRGLIIALHGGGGSALKFRRNSGMLEEAAKNGLTIVWPDSDGGNWNDGRLNRRGQIINDVDDEAFLLALVEDLTARGMAAREKIFIMGHSNGGMMSFYMGCRHPRVFKGIAPVSANVPRPMDCAGKGSTALLNIVGLQDRVVPVEGGGIFGRKRRGELLSAQESFAVLAERNRCQGTDIQDGKDVVRVVGKSCKAPTQQLRIKEQGHRFPENAAKTIVTFFGSL